MGRPTGITIIASLAWLAGVINILASIGYFFAMRIPYTGVSSETSALAYLVIGVVWLVIGYGFYMGLPWARTLGMVWAAVSILAAAWLVITNLNDVSAVLVPAISSVILPAAIAWYLQKDEVRGFFGATPSSRLSRM